MLLSCYILTFNSQKYLTQLLAQAKQVADEIVIIDSGSTDETLNIAASFQCQIFYQAFDNYRAQRAFAQQCCSNEMVLFLDSDEIPTKELIQEISELKESGFEHQAYEVKRNWTVLGKEVSVCYPAQCPDYPIRLLNKEHVRFDERSTLVHETPFGYETKGRIEAPLQHITFENEEQIQKKLEHYSNIAAVDLLERRRSVSFAKLLTSPIAAWCKWYLIKGGWKDGVVGWKLGSYAFHYTRLKYQKAIAISKSR